MFGRKKKKAESPSSVKLSKLGDDVFIVTVEGEFKKELFSKVQLTAGKEIDKAGSANVLIDLKGFSGWGGGPAETDLDFFAKYDAMIKKIAVVGDPRWKDESMMFLGAGYRQGEVQFFPAENLDQAKEWLRG